MFCITFLISFAFSAQQMMPGMGMMPMPMAPPALECDHLKSPLMCNLQKTKGQCAWLARDQKCDLAEKCSGRDQASCALYWTGSFQVPNCVWLAMEGKCDSSSKCYGRDKATCTNPAFPRCTWTMPFVTSWGQQFPGGQCTEFEGFLSSSLQQMPQMPVVGQNMLPGQLPTLPAGTQANLPATPGNFPPPIVPLEMECELLTNPMMCNLAATRGSCAWLATDQKCDIADKCSGRDRASCALYWKGNRMGPNCVWLALEEKCDSSKKCYGRDKASCTNPAFPRCTWQAPYMTSWGQNLPGGMCTEYKGPQMPFASMLEGGLQAKHMEEPETTSSGDHTVRNVALISVGSFFLTATGTFLVMSRSKRQTSNDLSSPL